MCGVSWGLGKAFPPSHLANCKTSADTARRLRPVSTMHFRDDLLPISESTTGNLALLPASPWQRPAAIYSRMCTREARCTCPPAHVTGWLSWGASSCSRAQRPLHSAGCRNECIFASPGPDTKFVEADPQMPILTGRVEMDDQTLTTLRRMFRPQRFRTF